MKFIDSHCHLDMDPLSQDQEGVIERAYKAGVEKMINVGSSIRGSEASIELANRYPNIWATVGLHPHDAEVTVSIKDACDRLREMAKSDQVVAIGEIGLDFFQLEKGHENEIKKEQEALFSAQLDLALELDLPVVIHTRDAEEDTLRILTEWAKKRKTKGRIGVVHCFTGDKEFAKRLIDLDFYIGFTGFITFDQPKFDHIREAVKEVPLEKILIETDAPFLAPEPYRGETNEPSYVPLVAEKIAVLKCLEVKEVAETTLGNAKKLFTLD